MTLPNNLKLSLLTSVFPSASQRNNLLSACIRSLEHLITLLQRSSKATTTSLATSGLSVLSYSFSSVATHLSKATITRKFSEMCWSSPWPLTLRTGIRSQIPAKTWLARCLRRTQRAEFRLINACSIHGSHRMISKQTMPATTHNFWKPISLWCSAELRISVSQSSSKLPLFNSWSIRSTRARLIS